MTVATTEITLQWGRVLMNAETVVLSDGERSVPELQWGRVLMNAETCRVDAGRKAVLGASMGPRSHERGNRPLDNSLRNKGFFACYREVVVCTRSHWLVGRVVMA